MLTFVFLTTVDIALANQRVSPSGRMNHGSWIKRQKRKLEPIDSIHIRPNFSKESRVGVSIAPHPPHTPHPEPSPQPFLITEMTLWPVRVHFPPMHLPDEERGDSIIKMGSSASAGKISMKPGKMSKLRSRQHETTPQAKPASERGAAHTIACQQTVICSCEKHKQNQISPSLCLFLFSTYMQNSHKIRHTDIMWGYLKAFLHWPKNKQTNKTGTVGI